MIICTYWQFLPHWAGPIIVENFQKTAKFFGLNIIETYIYPHLVAIKIDGQWDIENFQYQQLILEKPLPNTPNFIENLQSKLKNQEIIVEGNTYKIIKNYNQWNLFLKDMVHHLLTVNPSYPKNIFWSNGGAYTTPRPSTGYGYDDGTMKVVEGHCFPIQKYYQWKTWESYGPREDRFLKLLNKYPINITQEEITHCIYTMYNPTPLVIDLNSPLPKEIIESCLKNHNNGYLMESQGYKGVVFMDYQENKNLTTITQGYQETIAIRLNETAQYYQKDQEKSLDYWNESLKNIMFFENRIHMGHKKSLIDDLLKYLFNLKNQNYTSQWSDYLLDLNTKIVQEFNDLQGFMASYMMVSDPQDKTVIYDFYRKNYSNGNSALLAMAQGIFDSMMILGLGGIMTPHKDPYNLKGTIDQWIQLTIQNKLTLNYNDLIKIFETHFQEKFFWKNAIAAIESRWVLLWKDGPKHNHDIIGYGRQQESYFYGQLMKYDGLKRRLNGLLKKNNDDGSNELQENSNDKDHLMEKKVNELMAIDGYGGLFQWIEANEKFLNEYLDELKIKGNPQREQWIKNILEGLFNGINP
jgi:hypothetical protein